jgi:hypothetical protein
MFVARAIAGDLIESLFDLSGERINDKGGPILFELPRVESFRDGCGRWMVVIHGSAMVSKRRSHLSGRSGMRCNPEGHADE